MVREILLILILILLAPSACSNLLSVNQHVQSLNEERPNNYQILENTSMHIVTKNFKLEINPNNQDVKNYFQKVVDVPFKADYTSTKPKKPTKFWKDNFGDCDDKSTAFADYLYNIGAEDIKMVTIVYKSQEYAHACVMWKGRIFDASAEPPIYNMDPDRYFNFLEKKGFKLRVTHSYEPIN